MLENENKEAEKEIKVNIDLNESTNNYYDKYVRLLADFENQKKRHNETLLATENRLKYKANLNLIQVYNDAHLSTQGQGVSQETIDGITMFMSKIETVLNNDGIFKVDTSTYDIDNHEVIACLVPGSTTIVSVAKFGWQSESGIISYPQVVLG